MEKESRLKQLKSTSFFVYDEKEEEKLENLIEKWRDVCQKIMTELLDTAQKNNSNIQMKDKKALRNHASMKPKRNFQIKKYSISNSPNEKTNCPKISENKNQLPIQNFQLTLSPKKQKKLHFQINKLEFPQNSKRKHFQFKTFLKRQRNRERKRNSKIFSNSKFFYTRNLINSTRSKTETKISTKSKNSIIPFKNKKVSKIFSKSKSELNNNNNNNNNNNYNNNNNSPTTIVFSPNPSCKIELTISKVQFARPTTHPVASLFKNRIKNELISNIF
ncbi:swi5-dependent recombination DNA repair protein [Anaeramoeba ignava]|uniref:Swi5-dependent recombination DNA repair protein n=1 Tax=Anaeramoeba ignava TaxID=1746090 RepID=A0A9Q0L777_ANAIG|nr:swi5-dependent recombination DNA repair protein [Anaeramoeba ignava]